jgi:hypothetical protein
MSTEKGDGKIIVYFDGECPTCRALVDPVRNSADAPTFDLRDMHTEKRPPFAKQAIEKAATVFRLRSPQAVKALPRRRTFGVRRPAISRQACDQLADRRELVLIIREHRMFFAKPETGCRCWRL